MRLEKVFEWSKDWTLYFIAATRSLIHSVHLVFEVKCLSSLLHFHPLVACGLSFVVDASISALSLSLVMQVSDWHSSLQSFRWWLYYTCNINCQSCPSLIASKCSCEPQHLSVRYTSPWGTRGGERSNEEEEDTEKSERKDSSCLFPSFSWIWIQINSLFIHRWWTCSHLVNVSLLHSHWPFVRCRARVFRENISPEKSFYFSPVKLFHETPCIVSYRYCHAWWMWLQWHWTAKIAAAVSFHTIAQCFRMRREREASDLKVTCDTCGNQLMKNAVVSARFVREWHKLFYCPDEWRWKVSVRMNIIWRRRRRRRSENS